MKTKLLILLVVIGYLTCAQQPMTNTPGFNFFTTAISTDDDYVYVGGPTAAGTNIPNSLMLDLESNSTTSVFSDSSLYPELRYLITTAISDQNNGWYLTRMIHWDLISDEVKSPKISLMKLLPDGNEDELFSIPQINGSVSVLFLHENYLYVGGRFDSIGELRCHSIVRINLEDRKVDETWEVMPENSSMPEIYTIEADNEYVYFGGKFTTVNNTARNNLARVNLSSGQLDMAWNPNPNDVVYKLLFHEESIYLGGRFDQIGGFSRKNVAKINKQDGTVDTNWDTNLQTKDYCQLLLAGDHLYVGCHLNYSGEGENRTPIPNSNLARYSINNGLLDQAWKPDFPSDITTLVFADKHIFVGGLQITDTTFIFEKYDTLSGNKDQSFDLRLSGGWVTTLVANNNKILISGIIQLKNSIFLDGIGRLNKTTGEVDEHWKPELYTSWKRYNNQFRDLYPTNILSDNTDVYVGGSYRILSIFNTEEGDLESMINGLPPLKKIDKNDGKINEAWGTNIFGEIYSMVQTQEFLYIGGVFATSGPDSIPYLARVNKVTGTIDQSWNPKINGAVNKLVIDNEMLYIGGHFDSINTKPFQNLARISLQNGQVDEQWRPEPDNTVFDFIVDDEHLFVTGRFKTIGGATMPIFAKLNKINGVAGINWLYTDEYWPFNLEKINNEIATIAIVINSETSYSQEILRINKETGLAYNDWQISHDVPAWNMNGVYIDMHYHDKILYLGGYVAWSDVHAAALFSRHQIPNPVITVQPQQPASCQEPGQTINMEVYSEAYPITYQWQVKLNGIDWTDLTNANNSTLITAEINPELLGKEFRCVVTDRNGQAVSDSFVINVFQHYEATEAIQICEGTSINWHGNTYTTEGFYYDSLTTVHGCDSIFILHLTVHPVYEFVEKVDICQGEEYSWRGQSYSTTGIYDEKLQTIGGCDSIFQLQLTVHSSISTTLNASICHGETYSWLNDVYAETGTYTKKLSSTVGCDSTVTLNLSVQSTYEFMEVGNFCAGETFTWRGISYTEPGIYTDQLSSINDCDSVFTLDLSLTEIDPSITANESTLFANETDASYQWIDCNKNDEAIDGETAQAFTVSKTGSYACMISKNNCTVKSECIVVNVVGVNAIELASQLRMYPNPCKGKLNIEIGALLVPSFITIANITGQIIATLSCESQGEYQLDLSNQKNGIYLVCINQGNQTTWGKILITD